MGGEDGTGRGHCSSQVAPALFSLAGTGLSPISWLSRTNQCNLHWLACLNAPVGIVHNQAAAEACPHGRICHH